MDESPETNEAADALVLRLAKLKAQAVMSTETEVVVAADTVVSLDGVPLGKPQDKHHGIAMLKSLSGRRHQVVTGVCVLRDQQLLSTSVTTFVQMGLIDSMEAERYWASGEPLDKAGGYAIQGLGAMFVTDLQGSYSNVVGLPLYETAGLLKQVGLALL